MKENNEFHIEKSCGFFVLFTLSFIFGCYTPPKDDVLVSSAWNLCTKSKYDECISEGNKALAINPSNYYAYQVRAFCYQQKHEYDKAIADYTKLLESYQFRAVSYSHRGDCYRYKGEYDKAISDYRRSLETSPGFMPAVSGYEMALSAQTRDARAKYDAYTASQKKAIQRPGMTSPEAWFEDAKSAYSRKDYDLAIDLCSNALKRNPREASAFHLRGLAFSGKGVINRAIAEYTAAISLTNPQGVEYHKWTSYHNRGLCYARKNEYLKAIIDYNTALKQQRNYSHTYHLRGQALEQIGALSEALIDAKKAFSLQPNNQEYQNRVVNLENELGKQGVGHPRLTLDKLISLEMNNIEVRPVHILPGKTFDLILEYSLTDPRLEEKRVPVKFEYSILDKSRELFRSRSVEMMCVNGQRSSRIVHLIAAKKKGNYSIQALMKYDRKIVGDAIEFMIK